MVNTSAQGAAVALTLPQARATMEAGGKEHDL
jgi:hypothetical protein